MVNKLSNPYIIALIFIIITVVAILIYFTVVSLQNNNNNNNTIGQTGGMQCTRPSSQLIDITNEPCCCLSGNQTSSRYIPSLDVVVSTSPVYYLDACAGFCTNAAYDKNSETCQTGSSDKFISCVSLTKPINCTSPAMPVAIDGIQPYYVTSATMQSCQISASCAPEPNNCPL